jgi:hypothetical protein
MGVNSKMMESKDLEHGFVEYSGPSVNISDSIERKDEWIPGIPREMNWIVVSKSAHFFPFGFEQTQEGMKIWYNFIYLPDRQKLAKIDKLIENEKVNMQAKFSDSGETKLANLISQISWGSVEDDKQLNGAQVMTIRLNCNGEVFSENQRNLLLKEFKAMGDKITSAVVPTDFIKTLHTDVLRKEGIQ